jgi:hypothetical protein
MAESCRVDEAAPGDATIFRFIPCENRKSRHNVAVGRNEVAPCEALGDKAKGQEKNSYLDRCNPLLRLDSDE